MRKTKAQVKAELERVESGTVATLHKTIEAAAQNIQQRYPALKRCGNIAHLIAMDFVQYCLNNAQDSSAAILQEYCEESEHCFTSGAYFTSKHYSTTEVF
jgi:hypothetical protein